MSSFGDRLMVRYLNAANVDALLVPPADVEKQRVRALLAQVYEPKLLAVQSVDAIAVTAKSPRYRSWSRWPCEEPGRR